MKKIIVLFSATFSIIVHLSQAQNIAEQKAGDNFSYSQCPQVLNWQTVVSAKEIYPINNPLRLESTASDTNKLMLRIIKQKKKYYFVYDDQAPKLLNSGGGYSPEFKAILQTNPQAEQEFNESRYYGYASIVGIVAVTAFTAKLFINTLSQVNQLNNNTIPNTGVKLGDWLPLLLSAGFTVTMDLETKWHFKDAITIFNNKIE
jgi:hypothetical protein